MDSGVYQLSWSCFLEPASGIQELAQQSGLNQACIRSMLHGLLSSLVRVVQ